MSNFSIELIPDPGASWDAATAGLPGAGLFHRSGWLTLWKRVYGQRTAGLIARQDGDVAAALPLVRKSSRLFGRHWVSLPYFDAAGPCGAPEAETALLGRALELATETRSDYVEVRSGRDRGWDWICSTKKVHVTLPLGEDPDDLLATFKKKLRSQIRRAQKESPEALFGGQELVGEFYDVYSRRMRGLGSPAHSLKLFRTLLEIFPEEAEIVSIRLKGRCVSAALLLRNGSTVVIPWAATLVEVNPLSINMFLYYEALRRAVATGARVFDFGRCDDDSSHLKFKLQWGGEAQPLHWYRAAPGGRPPADFRESGKLQKASKIWRKLPLGVTRWLGPRLIRHLS